MEPTHVTCTRVEEEDLDARYLAGTLSEEEAEAFEEHYFGCERCWTAVQTGLDVRAASTATTVDPQVATHRPTVERGTARPARRIPRRQWLPLAIAASIVVVAVGLWQRDGGPGVAPGGDGLRGPADSIRAVASVRGRILMVSWPVTLNADRYRVRLQRSDATVVLERIAGDTVLTVSRDSLRAVADGERLYWEVQALDALRRTIARSRLVPTVVPGRAR